MQSTNSAWMDERAPAEQGETEASVTEWDHISSAVSHTATSFSTIAWGLLVVLLVFSLARYLIDGFALEMIGRSTSQGGDFAAYYLAGAVLRTGGNIYDLNSTNKMARTDPKRQGAQSAGYLYPPLLAIVMVPFSYLPFHQAYRLWVIGELLCLIASIWILAYQLPTLGKLGLTSLIILAGNMYPIYQSMDTGQVGLLILLILALVFRFARRAQFFQAGLFISLGGLIKISPFLLIAFFIIQRKWRALAGVCVGTLLLVFVTLITAGPTTLINFVHVSLGSAIPDQIGWVSNASLAGYIHRSLAYFNMSTLETPVRWMVWFICLGITAWYTRRQYAHSDLTFMLALSLWVSAMLLVSPITWEHHIVWLLPAFGVSLASLSTLRGRLSQALVLWFAGLYTVLAFENLVLNRSGQWQFKSGWWLFSGAYLQANFIPDLRLFGMIGFFAFLIVLLRHTAPSEPRCPDSGGKRA